MPNAAAIALDLFALTTLLGTLVVVLWVAPAPGSGRDALWQLAGATLVVLALLAPLDLLRTAAAMSGGSLMHAFSAVPTVLLHTHYGLVWGVRAASIAACLLLWLVARRSAMSAYPLLAAALLLAWSFSATGHGADGGDFSLPEMADWLHLLGAAAWGGGMVGLSLAYLALTPDDAPGRVAEVALTARRFSTVAAAGLTCVIVTGIYNAWVEFDAFSALWQTNYGRTLLIKLGLLLPLAALGASNRFLTVPALLQPAAGKGPALVRRFRRVVALEAVLFTAILACVGVLRSEAPPRVAAAHAHPAQPAPGQAGADQSRATR